VTRSPPQPRARNARGKTESSGRDAAIAETQNNTESKKKHKNFVQEEEKVREFGVTSHMPALESEVEHACGEEDPASDKQTSKYE
jgi:hypothetical protein